MGGEGEGGDGVVGIDRVMVLGVDGEEFVKKDFGEVGVRDGEKEKEKGGWEYDVLVREGREVEFDGKGEWSWVEWKLCVMGDGMIGGKIGGDIGKGYGNVKG